jgi:hypothetical protein
MKLYVYPLLALLSLISCKNNSDDTMDSAYFGGEVVNPNNDYVLLYSPKEKLDTLYLDNHNRFFIKVKHVEPGLYTFTHGGEYQMVLLEPKDSIMLRLNTIDFDESLVFTGNGAKKNNFLIKNFLENETEQQNFINVSQLNPEQFDRYSDSSRVEKLNELSAFSENKELSDLFETIAKTSINYNYYANKERYPFGYFGYKNLKEYKNLPENFYAYRKDIDYNIGCLSDFYIYNRFLYSHFNNIALDAFYKSAPENAMFDRESLVYNLAKLSLMDSLIKNEVIKNNLLKNTTKDYISMNDDSISNEKIIASFLEKSTNSSDKAYIKGLMTAIKNLKPGKPLPKIRLINYNETESNLSDLITKPTVIYFWSSNIKTHYRNCHYKVKELKAKYPNINFIAININDNDKKYWKKTLDDYKFPTKNEYQFKYPDEGRLTFVINTVSKVILVDKDLKIVDSNYNIFHPEFEEQLKKLNQ